MLRKYPHTLSYETFSLKLEMSECVFVVFFLERHFTDHPIAFYFPLEILVKGLASLPSTLLQSRTIRQSVVGGKQEQCMQTKGSVQASG